MKLSRTIPSRTKTLTALGCNRNWMPMTPRFRAVRSKARNPMDKCYWCKHRFEDGEMMALAQFEELKVGNRTLCQACADELLSSDSETETK